MDRSPPPRRIVRVDSWDKGTLGCNPAEIARVSVRTEENGIFHSVVAVHLLRARRGRERGVELCERDGTLLRVSQARLAEIRRAISAHAGLMEFLRRELGVPDGRRLQ